MIRDQRPIRVALIGLLASAMLPPWTVIGQVPEAKPATSLTLRVLSYNIHHGEGVDGRLDLPRIARTILAADPDLVALQEVDRVTTRTERVDQPAKLAELTKRQVVFGANLPLQGGHYGNAVLSRLPIARWQNHLLPSFGGGEQRGVLSVELMLPDGHGQLLLLASHFDFRRDHAERLASVEAISKLAESQPRLPALLAGDLNAEPSSVAMQALARHWVIANREARPTSPVERPTRQIDYVWYRPAGRWRVVECRVLDEKLASDHRPILAVLELLPP